MLKQVFLLFAVLAVAQSGFVINNILPGVASAVNKPLSSLGTKVIIPTNEPIINPSQMISGGSGSSGSAAKNVAGDLAKGNAFAALGAVFTGLGAAFCGNLGPDNGLQNTQVGDAAVQSSTLNLVPMSVSQFGGGMACSRNCNGTCVPNDNNPANAPVSAYPFACKCSATGCDENGPITTGPTNNPYQTTNGSEFALAMATECVPSDDCNCNKLVGGNSTGTSYNGYLCNWIGLTNHTVITYGDLFDYLGISLPEATATFQIDPYLSPIRWCECCPRNSSSSSSSSSTSAPSTSNPANILGEIANVNVGVTNLPLVNAVSL